MLTTEAFNALLKTLEEPPESVFSSWPPLSRRKFPKPFARVANPIISGV